ncbi:hypothetical protein AAZX31_20G007300 [Glycine max]|uniref:Uncharacterized protein n=2 Tax=Glycine subgen. Soja TaxID=1462606 RepID=K7N0M4_SOYBN|nr:extra-large guanine nucleotide-binding protein 1 [Glycine max]XP_028221287.1 extra-large guanine nucleotide-binding protein 1-like [Glycine soja]KAH1033965.1 hypothetical protein GYH30_054392 [Glycine max]KAH1188705.1 Extra-large guanine nucleotide-binding protein 1 [Glycine max]KHM99018.1 hypothetical protein glysoja_024318 [Glycine soja]KRG89200.1 hypothetical protein GLYMA_20G008000v4 [Glycine max]RZB41861.1 Extra-large guanine nucleotide-binding protein 1 [Glycine soja]|eukprot:XP_003556626.1 extra-large guanine nucleotide-binding protein 1 [Glycine max]
MDSSVPPVALETEDSISSYSIPEIPAFKLDQILVATLAPLSHDEFSDPVIQPLGKSLHKRKQNLCTADSAVLSGLEDSCAVISPPAPDTLEVPDDRDGTVLHTTSETTESGPGSSSTSLFVSSDEICSFREEEETPSPTPKHVKRVSDVIFSDLESNYTDTDEFDDSQIESVPVMERAVSISVMERAVRSGKKGSCYRCLKGNHLTLKEVCIVCSAKYCRSCVVRAMGSMPEGRKCVTCIGYRIDERNRSRLGKCSRMLKGLLSESEAAQAMDDERSCEANQIPPELVCVNLQPLNREQLKLLLNCRNPPKQLKTGSYWYDKCSGLWGKEGQPPSHLQKNASNGNTNVFINVREITKEEKLVLQVAGVPWEGTRNFWVHADGSYTEEGQIYLRGSIWHKRIVRLTCAVLSLPVPSKSVALSCEGEIANTDSLSKKILNKFLLIGSVNSDSKSFSWAVDNAIMSESETASKLGASPVRSFGSVVDNAIRSSSASEADLGTVALSVNMRMVVDALP